MTTLWLKFPDEVLTANRFRDVDKQKLEQIFSVQDEQSAWRQALTLLHLTPTDDTAKLITWYEDTPYFNWSVLLHIISGGTMQPVRTEEGKYTFTASYKMRDIWALLAVHWKIARFLKHSASDKPTLAESIALGIALQSLILRLGKDVEHMPAWLASPDKAPTQHRKTIQQIQSIQMQRTRMSRLWKEIFSASFQESEHTEDLPDFFWNDVVPVTTTPAAQTHNEGHWKGMSVCAGTVTGLAVAMSATTTIESLLQLKTLYNAPLILVFRRARPETTEYFEHAAALLFAEGGVLSHACTVAREMNIPSLTALGSGFYDYLKNSKKLWLTINGSEATVSIATES